MTLQPEERQRIEAIRESNDPSEQDVAWLLDLVERQEAMLNEIPAIEGGSASRLATPSPDAFVREFHKGFGLAIADAPTIPDDGGHYLRLSLVTEEFNEFQQAWQERDLIGIADALADLAYVIYGSALECGIPLDRVLAEVHRSNMSKLGADGKPLYREDGKVLKGPNYSPPNIAPLLALASPEELAEDQQPSLVQAAHPEGGSQ